MKKDDGLDHLRYTGASFEAEIDVDGREYFRGTDGRDEMKVRLSRVLNAFLKSAEVGQEIEIRIKRNEDA